MFNLLYIIIILKIKYKIINRLLNLIIIKLKLKDTFNTSIYAHLLCNTHTHIYIYINILLRIHIY